MITTAILTEREEIDRIIPECVLLAKKERASLPFQYMYMPLAWWDTFHATKDAQFWQKRGKNFLGVQSRLEKLYILLARKHGNLCGVAPLVQYSLKVSAGPEELNVIAMAGDYVLHPFQDFLIEHEHRQQIITAMLEHLTKLLKKDNSVVWMGYLPEESQNLPAIRQTCESLRWKKIEFLEAISSQRGGIWPWTINEIRVTLRKIYSKCNMTGIAIEGVEKLLEKIELCTPQSLLFPRTRNQFLQEMYRLLTHLQQHENLGELPKKLESLLENTPMLYPYIELPADREEYLSSLSYDTRRYFRRYMKKFLEAGGGFETVLPHEISKKDIEEYIRLHLLRWGDSSAAICGEAAEYHVNMSMSMSSLGTFVLFFAKYLGKRIAVHSCFDIGKRREGYITGVDPEFDKLRAGRLLYIWTIYDAIDKGYTRYELGAVGFDYKMSFAKKSAVAHNFFLFPAGQEVKLYQIFNGFECMEKISV